MTLHTTAHLSPVTPRSTPRRPLGIDEVEITGGYWGGLQTVNAANTLPHVLHWMEREGWIANFDLAASGGLAEGRRGREFSDSEIYKWLEAVAWELGREDNDELEAAFRSVVSRVAGAQEADGYIGTQFGHPGQAPRWSDMEWGHELYCMGHLFQAVVARVRTKPDADDGLVGVGRRAADLVLATFGWDGKQTVCGHAEIETALVELGRALDDARYIEQARIFIERRGNHVLIDPPFGREYYQDDVPAREATVLRGHSVRANYLASGTADVADETDDSSLLRALQLQWDNTAARRTYITGGQGSRHSDEAFGSDYELPSDRAYSETCAGIASVQFSWRLLLATSTTDPARYGDLIERTLYNVVATSPSADGRAFYYANTLHQREPGAVTNPDVASSRAQSSLRAAWFDVSCCPTNIARTLASLAAYVASVDDAGIHLHQYAPAAIRTVLSDGTRISLDVETAYPSDGEINVRVVEAGEYGMTFRIPGWATGATLEGETVAPGSVSVRRSFAEGEVIQLRLPMNPRFTYPNQQIDAVRGSVAVERGPEVLCVESIDLTNAGLPGDIGRAQVDARSQPLEKGGEVFVRMRVDVNAPDTDWPYSGSPAEAAGPEADVRLVPYHSWAERGPSTMRVWIPQLQD